jgi:hypothetical protein
MSLVLDGSGGGVTVTTSLKDPEFKGSNLCWHREKIAER